MAKEFTVSDLLADKDCTATLETLSFEKGMTLLEELVSQVERGTLPLDTTVRAYERGSLVLAHLKKSLEGAEEKIRVLKKGS
jgi:exodeoxyribonuclease VII small subunit